MLPKAVLTIYNSIICIINIQTLRGTKKMGIDEEIEFFATFNMYNMRHFHYFVRMYWLLNRYHEILVCCYIYDIGI